MINQSIIERLTINVQWIPSGNMLDLDIMIWLVLVGTDIMVALNSVMHEGRCNFDSVWQNYISQPVMLKQTGG